MMLGTVTYAHEAIVHLRVHGQGGQEAQIEAVIDTGFNGFLTLPSALIEQLGLMVGNPTSVDLIDGNIVELFLYQAIISWGQEKRDITVIQAENVPLIGMSMLYGHELKVEVVDGGSVIIESLE